MTSRPMTWGPVWAVLVTLGVANTGCMNLITTPEGQIGSYPILREWLDLSPLSPVSEDSLRTLLLERFPIGSPVEAVLARAPTGIVVDAALRTPRGVAKTVILADGGWGFPCAPSIQMHFAVDGDGLIEGVTVIYLPACL